MQPGPGQARNWARVRWVATVPTGEQTNPHASAPELSTLKHSTAERYAGPPSYSTPPRWGFPNLAWRWPTAVPGTASDVELPLQRLRMIARNAVAVLWMLAGLAIIAAAAETWRYVLLVISRESGLSPHVVGASDALVLAFSLLTFVMTLFAFAVTLWWLFVARSAAADEAGQHPPRPVWQVVVGTLVPGPNLVWAGSILAELEHVVHRRPARLRPRPSRLILGWWAVWIGNAVLVVLTLVWRMRDSAQADADAVLLSALTDATAAALAVLTALVVWRITRLLAPIDAGLGWREQVVQVQGSPEPSRRPRPATAVR